MNTRCSLVLILSLLAAGCLGGGETVISKEVDLPGGSYSLDAFEVTGEATTVSYNTTSQNDAAYDVCIFVEDEVARFKAGLRADGTACNERVRRATDHATLPPGEYYLGVRCSDDERSCVVSIEMMSE